MDAALRAGTALYNVGEYHAAHDPWESAWLPLEEGPDERLLHGLIQLTAAVHHARQGNREGATGLADSARGYLGPLPRDYRLMNLDRVRSFLRTLAAAPDDSPDPPPLTLDGHELVLDDIRDDFDAAALVAEALAAEYEYDESVITDAIDYAREERGSGRTRYTTFVIDFAVSPADRGVAFRRLSEHVDRERRKRQDVTGLFE